MFKGLSVFFETYSITSNDNKNSALHPIDVSCGFITALTRIKELLENLGYGSIVENMDFREIFAANENFEVTVSFIALPNSGTRIGVALYSPKHRKTKKHLIALMGEVSKVFANERIQ